MIIYSHIKQEANRRSDRKAVPFQNEDTKIELYETEAVLAEKEDKS